MKWRLLAAYTGGPLVTVLLLVVSAWGLRDHWPGFTADGGSSITPAVALLIANGFTAVRTLIPTRSKNELSPRNDIGQILRLPWLTTEMIAALPKVTAEAQLEKLLLLRKCRAANDAARRILEVDPTKWWIRTVLANLLTVAGFYAEAATEHDIIAAEPAMDKLPPRSSALLANNHAWAKYMLNQPAALEAAARLSATALALAPDNPYILGTRGAVLVALDELVAGQKLLERALRMQRDRRSKALNTCCLAMAAFKAGRLDDGNRLLDRAKGLDKTCHLLDRARTERDSHFRVAPIAELTLVGNSRRASER
jgi:predicted Zn-dependent protease